MFINNSSYVVYGVYALIQRAMVVESGRDPTESKRASHEFPTYERIH